MYKVGEWTNFGDVSPWHGQIWIKNPPVESAYIPLEDFAECVQTIGSMEIECLADNQLLIEVGSIYIPLHDKSKVESALDIIGKTPSLATWIDLALAFHAYSGVEVDYQHVIQIGKGLDTTCQRIGAGTMDSDIVLHGNAKIKNYLSANYLNN